MDIYKKASQLGLRFSTSKGVLSVESLWDKKLSLTFIEDLVRGAKKKLKGDNDDELSFLDSSKKVDEGDQLAFDILKDVYLTRKAENEALRTEKERKENNEKIMALIQEKKEGALRDKSVEELEAMLAN
jgi:hypothetical protein